MFDQNPTIAQKVSALFAHFTTRQRGDLVTWQTIKELTGLKEMYVGVWNTVMRRIKRKVERELGITLWADRKNGFRLLTIKEQLSFAPKKRLERAGRQVKRGMNHLDAIPNSELTVHQMAVRATERESLRISRNKILRDKQEVERLTKPKEKTPRIAQV